MKKLFPTLIAAACFLALGAQAANDIVFVDVQELFKGFYKTQLAQDQIQQQQTDIKLERETLDAEITVIKEEVETLRTDARDENLSEDAREGKRDLLEEKLVELQKRDQEGIDYAKLRQQQLEQQNTRMSRKLFDEIHEAISDYASEMGYAAVIDRSAQSRAGTQVVLFVNQEQDVTGELLAILNEGREETKSEETELNVEQ